MNIEFSKEMQKEFPRRIRGTNGCTPKGNCTVGCFLIHGANTIKSNAQIDEALDSTLTALFWQKDFESKLVFSFLS